MSQVKVTVYPKISIVEGGQDFDLSEVMEKIKGGYWKNKIENIRSASEGDQDVLKTRIPYFTGSGTFGHRNDNGIKEHSGRIIIDFDDIADVPATREVLISDQYSEYVFVSCSGSGIAVCVKIDPKKHRETYLFLENYYLVKYNLKTDKSCKDISRPRYISYDPDLFHNPKSIPAIPPSRYIESDDEKYAWAVNSHNKRHHFIEGNRHHYLVVLSFFLSKCGVSKDYALSQMMSFVCDPRPNEKEIKQIVDYCYEKKSDQFGTFQITKKSDPSDPNIPATDDQDIRKIYAWAHEVNRAGRRWSQHDVKMLAETHLVQPAFIESVFKYVFEANKDEFDIDNKPQIYKLEYFLNKTYDFARNVVTLRSEFKYTDEAESEYRRVNADTIYRDLLHSGFKYDLNKLKSLLKSDFIGEYDPFKTYFNSLPEWDGEDHIAALADHLKTTDQPFWIAQFTKALVRSLHCTLDHRENRIVMTLIGEKQNVGKSTFIRFLNPFKHKYYTESPIRDNKDTEFRFAENFIYNMEELASLGNIEINKLKAIISKSVIKERKAYAEDEEEQPRRCNFWGSTNKPDFLTDTQNTRWLCFEVVDVDWGYSKNIDINKVYSQAMHLYRTGFNCQLTADEANKRDLMNKNYEVHGSEYDLITHYFQPAPADKGEFMTSTQMVMEITEKSNGRIKLNSVAVGRALRQLGYTFCARRQNDNVVRGVFAYRHTHISHRDLTQDELQIPF